MNNSHLRSALLILTATLTVLSWTAFGQRRVVVVAGPDEPRVNAEQRAEIIERVCKSLNEVYVFPDKAEAMDELLHRKMEDGAYDDITAIGVFADQLTRDLHSVCRDLHLAVRPAPTMQGESDDEPSAEERRRMRLEEARYRNFGFEKIERLTQRLAVKRLGTFDDVINVVDFFASPHSDYVTGQIINLGGA